MHKNGQGSSSALRVIAVGAGSRTTQYCQYALRAPQRMRVVGVAEPDPIRRRKLADAHAIPPKMCFESYEQVAARPGLADAVINGTNDELHHASAVALLEAGYHMLLEKPVARTMQEVRHIVDTAAAHQRIVMICHVLRYTPFYQRVKSLLDGGAVGRIVALHSSEHVSYHHMATAFVRGKWNSAHTTTPMIIAKCCHDTDLIAWLLGTPTLRRIASVGHLSQFRKENAPPGSGLRCLSDCQIEATCPYSARRLYIDHSAWNPYVHAHLEHLENPTEQDLAESLATVNPYGRCVWRCDNDVVDHQHLIAEFTDGVTASHNMLCATSRSTRKLHIVGSEGELEGDFTDGAITVRRHKPGGDLMHSYETTSHDIDLTQSTQDGHGGGDRRLIEDFVSTLRGEANAKASTRVEEAALGFALAFYAHRSMVTGKTLAFEGTSRAPAELLTI